MKQKMFGYLNASIEQPLRYIGGELNSVVKNNSPASILLAFPDVYEIGMSHFGSRILYEQINYNSPYSMERVYMPWKDFIDVIKGNNSKLLSLETGKSFGEFDAVGFSLQHELCYTNVIAMLELGGIEKYSKDRTGNTIVIAGGGAVFNPAPMRPFIDVFAVGDGEELILDIMSILEKHKDRTSRLKELANVNGLYVPSVHGNSCIIHKRVLADLDKVPDIKHPLVPYMELVHDRITYEIQRGCNRSCRFCQAGIIDRPVRQRSVERIIDNVSSDIHNTGYRELGFLSLSAGDYPPIKKIISLFQKSFDGKGIYLSLPSLRVESIDKDFMQVLSKIPKSGFTIAPEAGSSRLRKVINKNISEEEILNTIKTACELGWTSIKAYFMLGLPTETDEDIEELIALVYKMTKEIKNKRMSLIVSFSNFVPKPHTPFQWERQLNAVEFNKKLTILKDRIKDKRVKLKWGDPYMSEIEGVFSRGDEKLADVVNEAYLSGELFSAWGNVFDYSKWLVAMNKYGLNIDDYLTARNIDEDLPWDIINTGVDKKWLRKEKELAYNMKASSHCTFEECNDCGVCSSYGVGNKLVSDDIEIEHGLLEIKKDVNEHEKKYRIRCLYKKTEGFVWLGHFELMNAIEKALCRAEIPVNVSKGFKPRPVISFSPPIGAGISSFAEVFDVFLYEKIPLEEFVSRVNLQLPSALAICKASYIPVSARSINESVETVKWRIRIKEQKIITPDISLSHVVKVERKGVVRELDLKEFITFFKLEHASDYIIIDFEIKYIDGRTLKPKEVLLALLPVADLDGIELVRKEVVLDGISFSC